MTRIIAGSRKGQRLRTPTHSMTRPTTDRVREAAFSVIADWAGSGGEAAEEMLAGIAFLDLYAGSGAIALEAASRGAQPVLAIESDAGTARIARENARTAKLPVRVQVSAVEKVVAVPAERSFDVVWADPPYNLPSDRLSAVVEAVVAGGWLGPNSLLVLERSSRDQPCLLPTQLADRWERRYGETTLYFAMKDAPC